MLQLVQRVRTTIGLILVLAPLSATAEIKAPQDRKAAPDFTLKDAAGAKIKLSAYRGNVVLLNFWATWCGPCKVEIPWFIEFESAYKERGLAIVGVSMDEDGWKAARPFIEKMKMT